MSAGRQTNGIDLKVTAGCHDGGQATSLAPEPRRRDALMDLLRVCLGPVNAIRDGSAESILLSGKAERARCGQST